jgi:hypothetical protein
MTGLSNARELRRSRPQNAWRNHSFQVNLCGSWCDAFWGGFKLLRHGMLEIIVVRPVVYCVPLALCALARPVPRLLHTFQFVRVRAPPVV